MRQLHLFLIALFGLLVAATPLLSHESQANSVQISALKRDEILVRELEKRKGGGGGGKGGGSSGGGSSSGGKTGGSGGSSGGSNGGATGSTSNSGGRSAGGSGTRPAYGGGGAYYGGGASVPYTAGARSPRGLGAVGLLPIAGLAFFPGLWLYGAYLYPYSRPYSFYNTSSRANETKPVQCLCQEYSECGCDDNDDPSFMQSVVGNGSTDALNSTLVRVATVNGTSTIFLNGTLPNGTTADGGTSGIGSIRLSGPTLLGWAVMTAAMFLAL